MILLLSTYWSDQDGAGPGGAGGQDGVRPTESIQSKPFDLFIFTFGCGLISYKMQVQKMNIAIDIIFLFMTCYMVKIIDKAELYNILIYYYFFYFERRTFNILEFMTQTEMQEIISSPLEDYRHFVTNSLRPLGVR